MRSLHKLPEACSQDIFVQDRKYACFLCFFVFFVEFHSARGLFTGTFRTRTKSLGKKKDLYIRAKSPRTCRKETSIFEKRPKSLKRDLYL